MKTLQFIADCPKHGVVDHPPNECYITQEYVAALLYKQLLCTRQISQNPYPIRILPS